MLVWAAFNKYCFCDPDTLSIIQNNLELIVSDMVKRNIGTHYLYSSPRLTSIVYALSIMSKNRKNTGHHWLASSLFLTTKNIAKNPWIINKIRVKMAETRLGIPLIVFR
jgi:hypothetical protein